MIDIRHSSGPPWHVECHVQRIGDDYLCRIHGGNWHIGAVALSQWNSGRAKTEVLTASGHKERGIAAHAAHTLCAATRHRVSCIAGVHYDSLNPIEIEVIVGIVHALTRRVARKLNLDQVMDVARSGKTATYE